MTTDAAHAQTPVNLDWIDRFIRANRPRLKIKEEDRLLYEFPDFAERSNITGLRILKALLAGQRIGAIIQELGDTDERRRAIETPFIDYRTLLTEPLAKSPCRTGVANMLYSRAHHSSPIACEIALTYKCSLKCPSCSAVNSCSVGLTRCAQEQPPRRWHEVFKRLRGETDINGVTFTGGEPLAYGDLPKAIRCAREEELAVHVVTSGEGLTSKMARRFAEYDVERVTLKVFSTDEAILQRWTGGTGHLERVKAALRALAEVSVPTRAYAVLARETTPGFAELLKWVIRNHLSELIVELAVPTDRSLLVPVSRLNASIKTVADVCAGGGVRLLWAPSMPICLVNPIRAGAYPKQGSVAEGVLHVAPDGTCLTWPRSSIPIGNVIRQPVKEIWDSAQARRLRTMDLYPEPCRKCGIVGMCRAGSPWVRPAIPASDLRPSAKAGWRGKEDFAAEEGTSQGMMSHE